MRMTALFTEGQFDDVVSIIGTDDFEYKKCDDGYVRAPLHADVDTFMSLDDKAPDGGSDADAVKVLYVMTKEEFVAMARKVHGDRYDYSRIPQKLACAACLPLTTCSTTVSSFTANGMTEINV